MKNFQLKFKPANLNNMEDELTQAWNAGWSKASLKTKAIIIIETELLLTVFKGDATNENCDVAHKAAIRCAERIINEVKTINK